MNELLRYVVLCMRLDDTTVCAGDTGVIVLGHGVWGLVSFNMDMGMGDGVLPYGMREII